ncbi:MAG: CDP-alcohol phosphatidyltransferase family protein [Chloroflexaceae bacterium]|nr:CDP-alcohol phosphatidyltransferase family protein [Chloroflexaceae bacterium]
MALKPEEVFHPRVFLYPSNMLSLGRLLVLPLIVVCLTRPGRRREALVLLGLSMLTDVLDGPIARWRGEVSPLGEMLDPVADKVVINTVAVTLSWTRQIPWWMTGLFLLRDIGIVASGIMLYRRRAHIATSLALGKATTVVMTVALLLWIADGPRSGKPALMVTLFIAALSACQYWHRFSHLMRG